MLRRGRSIHRTTSQCHSRIDRANDLSTRCLTVRGQAPSGTRIARLPALPLRSRSGSHMIWSVLRVAASSLQLAGFRNRNGTAKRSDPPVGLPVRAPPSARTTRRPGFAAEGAPSVLLQKPSDRQADLAFESLIALADPVQREAQALRKTRHCDLQQAVQQHVLLLFQGRRRRGLRRDRYSADRVGARTFDAWPRGA